jgi:hypothetical protein
MTNTMDTGMLWYDDDRQRSLEDKVRRAADYYRRKYGRAPNLCLLNPQSLNGGPDAVNTIELQTAPNILPHHFWIGVASQN